MKDQLEVFLAVSHRISYLRHAKEEMSSKLLRGRTSRTIGAFALRAAKPTAPHQNVIGIGIDEKYVSGAPSGILAIKFLVRSKLPEGVLPKRDILPKTVGGLPTDIEEVGIILPAARGKSRGRGLHSASMPNPRARWRPAQPGSSIGFREPSDSFQMAGTFGALVQDSTGNLFILSNNHVLAYENGIEADGETRRDALPAGAAIFQPGLLDGGRPRHDRIAKLSKWIDLRADRSDNKADAAIAVVDDPNQVSKPVLFIGPIQGVTDATRDMTVHKFGRTTSYTAGRVSSVEFDVSVPYEVGEVIFQDQIAVRGLDGRSFSDSGDSGSAIMERATNEMVGLLFAGATGANLTFANHIRDVLSLLKVKLA
ncbi:MAG: hypothetical protein GHCLOJNM_01704 [bacterium]|nr:hypothetical protein [bacterium]